MRRRVELRARKRDKRASRIMAGLAWWNRTRLYVRTLDMPDPPRLVDGWAGVRWLVRGGMPEGRRGR